MPFKKPLLTLFSFFAAVAFLSGAEAAIYIDIDSPGGKKLPVAVIEPIAMEMTPAEIKAAGEKEFEALKTEIRNTVTVDMDFSGLAEVIEKAAYIEPPVKDILAGGIDFALWRAIGAELLVKSGIKTTKDKLTAEFRAFDIIKESEIFAKRYVGRPDNAVAIAHRFSDDLMERLTGKKGVFSTKIAFVSDVAGSKEIYVSDYDGRNAKRVTGNSSINLSPRWSPDAGRIIYTSYKTGRPCVFESDLRTGAVSVISDRPGSNIAGDWSPDGRSIALTLTEAKSPELFVMSRDGKRTRRLTDNYSIDVSPTWSPDGTKIAYTSDAAGNPNIYVINSTGGDSRRLTYGGRYNSQPSWSPDGKLIAYSRQDDDGFHVYVTDESGGNAAKLTFDGNDTSPSWSPDGRHIVFSRDDGHRSRLFLIRRDGGGLRKIDPIPGNVTGPAWSPWFE
ncbi:MAG TPA: Tol-Pal system beta propeller repeat protein TolB [Thermodesulfobacteriota bacterium]|nr:Tol-Pal system beta propeller repeat protein TolB [Thermodesulfobacteriota bacterium]